MRAPVVLVEAPAGYGKTELLAEWSYRTPLPVAWVTLRADLDANGVAAAVLDAVAGQLRGPGIPSLGRTTPADLPESLHSLLAGGPDRVVLVLDDVHEVTTEPVAHQLTVLLHRCPERLCVVLAGRARPAVHLGRLHAAGRLCRLGVDALRFSGSEARELAGRLGTELTAAEVDELVAVADGWPVALRLALAASAHVGPGVDPLLGDYLDQEVLAAVPQRVVAALERVGVDEHVPLALAVELTGDREVAALLAEVERATGLVRWTAEPTGTYSVHPLLRAHLMGRLERRGGQAAALRMVASRWFATRGRTVPALQLACAGDDPAWLHELLLRHGLELAAVDPWPVADVLRELGAEAVTHDRRLAALAALVDVQRGDAASAALFLHGPHSGCAPARSLTHAVAAAQHTFAFAPTPPGHAAELGTYVAGALRPADAAWVHTTLGYLHLRLGEESAAANELSTALDVATRFGFTFVEFAARVGLAVSDERAGRLDRMVERASAAVASAADHGWTTSPWLVRAQALLAMAAAYRMQPRRVLDAVEAARAAGGSIAPALGLLLVAIEALARADLGDPQGAAASLREVRRDVGSTVTPHIKAWVALAEQRIVLRTGSGAAAAELHTWSADLDDTAERALLDARAHLAAGRLDPARRLLEPVVRGEVRTLLAATLIDADLLLAELAEAIGRRSAAVSALENALHRARRSGVLRPFAFAAPPVQALLVEHLGGFGAADEFAGRVLGVTVSHGRTAGRRAELTEREHVVLTRLASQRSLDEIAQDLGVSPNTIKSHLRSIHAKLGTSRRRDAVIGARSSGLL